MILVDTSVWVLILRDKKGSVVAAFRKRVGSDITVLSRFNQLELLQGAKDLKEWKVLLLQIQSGFTKLCQKTDWIGYVGFEAINTTLHDPLLSPIYAVTI